MSETTVACHACGREHAIDGPVGRRQTCDGCGADLRCCRNCTHYDESSYNECREPSAERVLEKESATFCDYFSPRAAAAGASDGGGSSAVEDLEKLFGGKS